MEFTCAIFDLCSEIRAVQGDITRSIPRKLINDDTDSISSNYVGFSLFQLDQPTNLISSLSLLSSLFPPSLLRLHLLLQGEGVLEVRQPEAHGGARIPQVHPARLDGLRPV